MGILLTSLNIVIFLQVLLVPGYSYDDGDCNPDFVQKEKQSSKHNPNNCLIF